MPLNKIMISAALHRLTSWEVRPLNLPQVPNCTLLIKTSQDRKKKRFCTAKSTERAFISTAGAPSSHRNCLKQRAIQPVGIFQANQERQTFSKPLILDWLKDKCRLAWELMLTQTTMMIKPGLKRRRRTAKGLLRRWIKAAIQSRLTKTWLASQ